MASQYIIIIFCLQQGPRIGLEATQVPQYNSQAHVPSAGLDHVYLVSNWVLDHIIPAVYNESVIFKEVLDINESFMNPELGVWEKTIGICLVLVKIAGHHPGFSVIFGLNIVLAFSLPVAGLIFWCCHLCGKCRSRAKRDKCDPCKKVIWGSMLSMCHAALFITSVAALLATFKANTGAENLPGTLKNISEDVETYFNHTKDSFQTVLVDNAEIIETEWIRNLVDDPENSLIAKLENLERLYNTSTEHINALLSLCNVQETCSDFLERKDDIERYLVIDIGKIISFRRNLEAFVMNNETETNTKPLTKKLHTINKEIQDKLSSIQSLLENLTNTILTNSSSYQKYLYYVFIGGIVLVSMVFILLLCYVIGIFLIMFGSSATEADTCGPNETSGGKFLYSSVYLMFIFSIFLFLLAGGTFALAYWARLGLCKPLQDPQDSFLFHTLDQNIPYLGRKNLTSADILQRCHENQTIYNVLRLGEEDRYLSIDNSYEIELDVGITENLVELKNAGDAINGVISKLEDIRGNMKDVNVDDEISELKVLQRTLSEIEPMVTGLAGDRLTSKMKDIAQANIIGPIRTEVGPCSPLSTSYNSTVYSICTNIMEPVTAIWFSVQGSLLLCLVSIPLAVMLASLSKYKEEYMGVFMIDVDEPLPRVSSNLAYRASRII